MITNVEPNLEENNEIEIENSLKNKTEKIKFNFTYLPNAKFPGFNNKETKEYFEKWGLEGHTYVERFSYDEYFQSYQIEDFLQNFFNNPEVRSVLKVYSSMDKWGHLGEVKNIQFEELNKTATSLDFFDKLEQNGIIRSDGTIIKCFDEYTDHFLVSDELRKCILMPEFETYDIFTEDDRKEFLFHIFKSICLGGYICQYEDDIQKYFDISKLLYKDFVRVTRDNKTKKLNVISMVYKINDLDSSISPLFPIEHPQNFMYLTIDPMNRYVTVWYHASDSYYQ
ncbi:hypothetical protein H8356DRAFT_1010305 [Neocallimastix lanati (nom. inval.)]|jgi:hypothetical protein|uniref:Cilia- and flagella-associated protein 300 n=1 Tax=Neocallimastix californiae TaxID=1754190 RepID=A0A1Y2CP08_9FUNG|nr:hypothetical protein H8356DRAFT_1010305 [Neocallimastix sp. JGI-2020a]ORY48770.1 hypothetical protein LY90DRAFT_703118 [Neocallimastix californiae]|eukprot:ORY48770.1 hypothetical protein LY90DRAFT_703118 [Neocallimastix californiae]